MYIEQLNACGDDNDQNNDDNSHDEDVYRTGFTMNLISGQELKSEGRGVCAEGRGSEAPRVKEAQDPKKTF